MAAGKNALTLVEFKQGIERSRADFKAALPAHIPVAHFERVYLTAVQMKPELLLCERRSLFTAAMQAAHDGLLPDGREGALVPFYDKKRGMIVVWEPMVAGIRKKVRNSGEIATMDVEVVFEKDEFDFQRGDDPFIKHKPYIGDEDPGKLRCAYSIVRMKTGELSREVMSAAEIIKIRDRYSQSWRAHVEKGFATPWLDSPGEMYKKTVFKRHSKVLPMNTDLADLLRRDDELYDFKAVAADAKAAEEPRRRRTLEERLNSLAEATVPIEETAEFDPDTGEIVGAHEEFAVAGANGPNRGGAEEIDDDGQARGMHGGLQPGYRGDPGAIEYAPNAASSEQPSSDFPGDRPAPAQEAVSEAPRRRPGRPRKPEPEPAAPDFEDDPPFGRSRAGAAFPDQLTANHYAAGLNVARENPDKLKWWTAKIPEKEWQIFKPFAAELSDLAEESADQKALK